jgi:hypothetical protein
MEQRRDSEEERRERARQAFKVRVWGAMEKVREESE